jgi:hypothetical protein
MKRTFATIALAATLVMLTGLLGTVATAASASPPKLSAMLLSIDQMPTGWAVDNSSGGGGVGCLKNLMEPNGIKQTAKATVNFEDNENVPEVSEALATYTNAKTRFRKIVANLTACKHINGEIEGKKATGTVGLMSFPRYGNASEAFAASITTQGMTFGEDIVIVREGSIVMGLAEDDLVSVDVSQFQGFVKNAIKKVG